MSAAALARARREAILKSRGDRLAKLTSSARGEDPGGVYARNDLADNPLSNWGSEEQQQLNYMLNDVTSHKSSPFATPLNQAIPQVPEDPLSALFTSIASRDNNAFVPPHMQSVQYKTLLQRLLPLLHLLCMIGLLVWFVLWQEPGQFIAAIRQDGSEKINNFSKSFELSRWAGLSKGPAVLGLAISPLPAFFWAFTTVELILHSIRLFSVLSEYQPSILISLILPHLPPPLSQVLTTSLKYFHMASLVLDDLAILLFGIAILVFVSSWTT